MKEELPSQKWVCSWEEAELLQLRRGAARSFRENLIWLEHATEFARKLQNAPTVKHPGFPKILPKK